MPIRPVIPTAGPSPLPDAAEEFSAVHDSLSCLASLIADMRDPIPGHTLYFLLDTICQRLAAACRLLDQTGGN